MARPQSPPARRRLRTAPHPCGAGAGRAGGRRAGLLAAVGLTAAAGVGLALRPTRVLVEGASMEPTLTPGDRLLLTRSPSLTPGDLVAVRDPRQPARLLVKRVARLAGDGLWLLGDNPAASTDSRSFGTVARGAVVGRVRYRYAPPGRVGPLRRQVPPAAPVASERDA